MLLVTGITGHSGRYFFQELVKNNYRSSIRFIVRETSDISFLVKSGLTYELAYGDLCDVKFLEKSTENIDEIVHIANIRHTPRVLRSAMKNQVGRLICVHTTGIYSKFRLAAAEYESIEDELQRLLSCGSISMTILRPTMIFGDLCDRNMSKFIKMIDRLRVFPVINQGNSLIQPVNARDLGKAYYQVLMKHDDKVKQEYILSGEKAITMKYALTLISNLLGKKTQFVSVPLSVGVMLSKTVKALSFGQIDYVERVQRMGEDRCFSHDEASIGFQYEPESFDIGIAREVDAYRHRVKGLGNA